jgi:transcriptional regulator with XRE-family HTH domain
MRTNSKTHSAVERVALALAEARVEHGLSQRQLAALSGVSRRSISKLEAGGRIDPMLVVKLGATLAVFDLYRPPRLD